MFAQLLTPEWFILALSAYVLGSISTAILTCKILRKPDPRSLGSKNPGATNVLRVAGKKAAAITLLGDFSKGAIPVLIGHLMEMDDFGLWLIGFSAFLGHLYPLFFGFLGGKGVATGLGAVLAFNGLLGLALIGIWLFIAKGLKISSVSALIAFAMMPGLAWWMGFPVEILLGMGIMSALVIWRHRSNIKRLLEGEEH